MGRGRPSSFLPHLSVRVAVLLAQRGGRVQQAEMAVSQTWMNRRGEGVRPGPGGTDPELSTWHGLLGAGPLC